MFNNAGKAYKVQGKTDNIDDYAYNGKKGEYAESKLPKMRLGVNVIQQWVTPSQPRD